jgi:hypothetical protein
MEFTPLKTVEITIGSDPGVAELVNDIVGVIVAEPVCVDVIVAIEVNVSFAIFVTVAFELSWEVTELVAVRLLVDDDVDVADADLEIPEVSLTLLERDINEVALVDAEWEVTADVVEDGEILDLLVDDDVNGSEIELVKLFDAVGDDEAVIVFVFVRTEDAVEQLEEVDDALVVEDTVTVDESVEIIVPVADNDNVETGDTDDWSIIDKIEVGVGVNERNEVREKTGGWETVSVTIIECDGTSVTVSSDETLDSGAEIEGEALDCAEIDGETLVEGELLPIIEVEGE